jgi:hypothetical protein
MEERVRKDVRGVTTGPLPPEATEKSPARPAVAPDVTARPAGRGLLWLLLLCVGGPLLPLLTLAFGPPFYLFTPVHDAPRNRKKPAAQETVPAGPVLDETEPPGFRCKVHQAALRTDYVPIEYGLIRESEQDQRDRPKLFPRANERYLGGCEPKEPRTAKVSYCPACRQALAEWKKANPGE